MAKTKLRVNADAYSYTVPNPTPNGAPLLRTAGRGEVIEVDETEAERGRSTMVTNHYPDPGGTPSTVMRSEPALVDPDAQLGEPSAERAKTDSRIAELEAEVARLRAERPPVADTSTPGEALPVTLTPAQSGARELPALDAEAKAAKTAKK